MLHRFGEDVPARAGLTPIALGSSAAGACLGPSIVIYAAGLARTTFRLHCVEAPLLVGCMFAGAWLGGTEGAAWGVAVDQALMVPLWFLQLRRSLVPPGSSDEASDGAPEDARGNAPDDAGDAVSQTVR